MARERMLGRTGRKRTDPPVEPLIGGFAEAPTEPFDVGSVIDGDPRVETILGTARDAGLLDDKTARISGRISPALIDRAKRRTGIGSDTDLIEFALANVALDDDFAAAFKRSRGTIDPDLKLGF